MRPDIGSTAAADLLLYSHPDWDLLNLLKAKIGPQLWHTAATGIYVLVGLINEYQLRHLRHY